MVFTIKMSMCLTLALFLFSFFALSQADDYRRIKNSEQLYVMLMRYARYGVFVFMTIGEI